MKCKRCGAENEDGALTCASCGEPLAEAVQEEEARKAEPTEEEKPAEEAKPAEEEKSTEEEKPAEEAKPTEEENSDKEERPTEEEKPAEDEKSAEKEKPAEDEKSAEKEKPTEEEKPAEEEKPTEEEKTAIKLRTMLLALVLTLLGLAAVWAVATYTVASTAPPPLTDAEALDGLPEGADILARHELENGHVQQVDYFYTDEHKYCLVNRTERATFRYGDGGWALDGEPEVLAEQEDWSGLAGYWTEQTGGREALFLRLRVTGFGSGLLKGEVLYQDGTSACEGPAEELFSVGEKLAGAQTWFLAGTGFFRYNYLRVDRDGGVFFDNDITPMVQSDQPSKPPVAE